MTHSQVDKRAEVLLSHCLDAKGVLQSELTLKVFRAVGNSNIPDKFSLLRQLLGLIRREEHRQRAKVVSSGPLDAGSQSKIERWIKDHFVTIRDISYAQDPSLLGGFTIQAEDAWYDLSVKHKLRMIEEHLG